ncbi:OmpA family protein, partial [Belliella aquatica]
PDAAEVLDRASEVLAAYPDFNLNITSHTDARASNAYNERLSQNRSNSAANYLKGTGVVGERLSTAWKGEQEPVNPCVEGVDCPESMHDRNRRSILSLELYPDLDGDYSLPGGLSYVKSTDELMEAIASMVREKQASLLPLILAEDMVYYDLDKYEIRPDASKVLKAAEDLLKKYPFLKLEIASHTD